MQPDEERIVSVDQLPEDPLAMPPPYWRSSGAVFCLLDAVEPIPGLLTEMVPVLERTKLALDIHYEKYPDDEQTEEEMEEFSEIMDDLWELEHRVKTKAPVVVLMSAIAAEDTLNRFCVYNIHKDFAQSIERLRLPDRLLVAAGMVGQEIGKGHPVYQAINALTHWRNAFAHGHCVNRPTRSLRHNHLVPPDHYPGIISHLADLQRLVSGFVQISEYLSSISRNSYTGGRTIELERLKGLLAEIARYRFLGDDNVYTIIVSDSVS